MFLSSWPKSDHFVKILSFGLFAALAGCGSSSSNPTTEKQTPPIDSIALSFKPMAGEMDVDCNNTIDGLGMENNYSVGVGDLRFYVSNLKFYDSSNQEITFELDQNDFQYVSDAGEVTLVDLTSNAEGYCGDLAADNTEGTARTNSRISGKISDSAVQSVSFDVGIPQALMKNIIETNTTPEGSPSPMAEMYWSWQSGYRHFVMNFTIMDMHNTKGEGFIHVGSRGCSAESEKALESKSSCDLLNTAKVMLSDFDPSSDTVVVDINELLSGLHFKMMGDGHGSHNQGSHGQQDDMKPSVSCHSGATQMDCTQVFPNLGLTLETGAADANENKVFKKL